MVKSNATVVLCAVFEVTDESTSRKSILRATFSRFSVIWQTLYGVASVFAPNALLVILEMNADEIDIAGQHNSSFGI